MIYALITIVLVMTIFFETSLLSLPLVVGLLIMLTALFQKSWIWIVAFVCGIVLDLLTFHPVGASSVFFSVMLGLIFLYQRKFEIQSPFFVGTSVFIFSLFYGAFFIQRFSFFSAIITALGVSVIYAGIVLVHKPKEHALA